MKEKIDKFCIDETVAVNINQCLNDLLKICQLYEIPMFATVVTESTEEQTVYNNVVYGCNSHLIKLKDDQIRKHMLIAGGFEITKSSDGYDVIPERQSLTIDASDDYFFGDDDDK